VLDRHSSILAEVGSSVVSKERSLL
jgi:hypothetical protein